jgi:hypothetical protein
MLAPRRERRAASLRRARAAAELRRTVLLPELVEPRRVHPGVVLLTLAVLSVLIVAVS